ncbi:MAG: ATP synthase F1 subunit gamma [Clostridia bacterium]|nr:ATP synthase F1 subunit gamma [Clostridia bacterium]
MSTANELKNRIDGIGDIRKITKAMYLIASRKLSKAKADMDRTRPYYEALKNEIHRIFRVDANIDNVYFYPPGASHDLHGPCGFLVITADKGLSGAYNQNAIKEALRVMEEHSEEEYRLFVVGEYGRRYFESHGYKIEKSFLYTAQNPNMDRAREISAALLDLYDDGKIVKLYLIYTDMTGAVDEQTRCQRLLPLHRADFGAIEGERAVKEPFEFTPSLGEVLNSIIPSYMAGFIYSALIDSFCSEQNARMLAMDSASTNADDLISRLSVEYNHERQGAITRQITEMSSGVRAIRRKREE